MKIRPFHIVSACGHQLVLVALVGILGFGELSPLFFHLSDLEVSEFAETSEKEESEKKEKEETAKEVLYTSSQLSDILTGDRCWYLYSFCSKRALSGPIPDTPPPEKA